MTPTLIKPLQELGWAARSNLVLSGESHSGLEAELTSGLHFTDEREMIAVSKGEE